MAFLDGSLTTAGILDKMKAMRATSIGTAMRAIARLKFYRKSENILMPLGW